MFCGNCGEQLQDGDAFCGVCGTPAEAAGAPAAPPQPAPAKQPPAPKAAAPKQQKPQAPAPQQQQAPQPKDAQKGKKPLKKKATPVKAKKDGGKSGGGKGVLILVLVLVLVGACAAAWYFFKGPGSGGGSVSSPMAGSTTPAPESMNVDSFAGQLCSLAKSNPMSVDNDLYNFEFHALMSATPELLESINYTMDEYVDFTVKDLQEKFHSMRYEKTVACKIYKAESMGCSSMYSEMVAALEKQGVAYDVGAVNNAGRTVGLKSCGMIVLDQTWSETTGPNPMVYFVGSDGGAPKVLQYFYSENAE